MAVIGLILAGMVMVAAHVWMGRLARGSYSAGELRPQMSGCR